MRAIATITVYINGKDEQDVFIQAEDICNGLNKMYDCSAKVEHLNHAPHGTIDPMEMGEIDISKLKSNV